MPSLTSHSIDGLGRSAMKSCQCVLPHGYDFIADRDGMMHLLEYDYEARTSRVESYAAAALPAAAALLASAAVMRSSIGPRAVADVQMQRLAIAFELVSNVGCLACLAGAQCAAPARNAPNAWAGATATLLATLELEA